MKYDNVEKYTVLESKRDGVHWGWWVMWLLVFWPLLIAVALVHFSSGNVYRVGLIQDGAYNETKWISESELSLIKKAIFK